VVILQRAMAVGLVQVDVLDLAGGRQHQAGVARRAGHDEVVHDGEGVVVSRVLDDQACVGEGWRLTARGVGGHILPDTCPTTPLFHCTLLSIPWNWFLDQDMPVRMAETIISVNLLERLGGGWHWQASLRRIKGLTFIE